MASSGLDGVTTATTRGAETPEVSRRTCFVISPIGAEGSAVRKHADDVFDYVIQPALEQCGIDAFRSDHLDKPGRISEQMFGAILGADLCVAVLTGYNPNVFYELAIAQSAQRPVIILIEKGNDLPFDISDLRAVYYDLEIRSYKEQTYIRRVINFVREFEATDWRVSPLGWDILLKGGLEDFKVHPRSHAAGGREALLKLLEGTHEKFDIMGINLNFWRSARRFSEHLVRSTERGCRPRILLMHPDNPTIPFLINSAVVETALDEVQRDTATMFDYFSRVAQGVEGIEVRQIRTGCPHQALTVNDHVANVLQYLYSEKSGYSPLWEFGRTNPLYEIFATEFESLWSANEPRDVAGSS